MAAKSIIQVDVDDSAFKRFQSAFEKYQAQVAKTPQAWGRSATEARKLRASFEAAAGALVAQAELAHKTEKATKATDQAAKSGARHWTSMARATKDVASNIAKATREFVKWTGVITAFTGLLGAGGLFGIERLAGSVFAGRRSSLGLGLPYGAQQAFGIQFGRLVDPGTFLGGISAARANPALTAPLRAIGMGNADFAGDTGQVAVRALERLKAFADRTPDNQLGLYASRLGLGQLGITEQELRRLKATSPGELAHMEGAYRSGAGALGLGAATQKAWSDFKVQLAAAGAKIENVFVRGLTPLVPQLDRLSSAFADAVKILLGSDGFKWAIDGVAVGLKEFATYVGSPQFRSDVKTFADDFEIVAKKIAAGLRWLGIIPSSTVPSAPSSPKAIPSNNPGNLKTPGGASFRRFSSSEEGLRVMAAQLRRDEYVHGQDTLRQIIYGNDKWPGYSTTDREAYLRNVSRQAAIGPDEKLNLNDNAQLAKVIAAMTKQENRHSRWHPAMVVEILNNTGGNAYVQAAQAAQ